MMSMTFHHTPIQPTSYVGGASPPHKQETVPTIPPGSSTSLTGLEDLCQANGGDTANGQRSCREWACHINKAREQRTAPGPRQHQLIN